MSISKWLRQSALVCAFVGPYRIDIQDHPYVKATTPDQLIEAAVIESIAKDFCKWSTQGEEIIYPLSFVRANRVVSRIPGSSVSDRPNNKVIKLLNRNKQIECVLTIEWEYVDKGDMYNKYYGHEPRFKSFTVNGVELTEKSADKIIKSFMAIRDGLRKIEAEAQAALEKQKLEDKKWNVAENLLGLKRNEFGALVPKTTVEG